jgi:glycosyltransferase involved in cell wall biosynthesis
MKIGVAIITSGNRGILYNTINNICGYTPDDFEIVIVDDASDIDVPYANYRFNKNVGVAKAKNKCLELLENCDHIFLFDDDCYPIADNWWKPYIESGENHLMYQFKLPNRGRSDMRVLYQDDKLVSYSHTRGAMIYVTKKVLETVGGFDEEYGTHFEHPDYTNRIHNAGLTTHRAAGVEGSDKLLYCLDQDGKIESSIQDKVAKKNWPRNYKLYQKNKKSKEYKAYK